MGFIEDTFKIFVIEHSFYTLIALAASTLSLTLLRYNKVSISKIENGKTISHDDVILVGAPENQSWRWFAKTSAMFRYIAEGHYLMFQAFKEVSVR
jgi:hypothetical protein